MGSLSLPANTRPVACIIKHIMIVNDNSRVVRMTILSAVPSCGIPYDYHSDNSRGVINAPGVINNALREHL